ncbi:MAG TPA: FAD-binding oxidoreductase [Acidimicrobiales bacterium]|nr:FAD-binding oxidoreductase [Acidimicrobiales bacterium]
MRRPVPVIEVEAEPSKVTERLIAPSAPVADSLLERLRSVCAQVDVDDVSRMEAGRDWWPIAISWAVLGEVPSRPAAVARPSEPGEVAAVLGACNEARVPVTAMAGRSGVCGSSVPAFGGVALDLCALSGITDLDTTSLLAHVLPGTFGPDLEAGLQAQGTTLGHWPQSMDISTVGGWLACRGAGQYSTRYGKIEDMVAGLEVALADGSTVRTGGCGPRSATGGDLTQLFVGSEGTLGIVTGALLRLHPVPPAQARRAFGFGSFEEGLEACRLVMRRGATPAVVRLYDEVESARNFSVEDRCLLVVLDEADAAILDATFQIVDAECVAGGGTPMDEDLVERWLAHRNDVSALAPLYKAGIVVDTIEISARWAALAGIYRDCVSALESVEGTLAASAHQSHAYTDGACLYFTFGGRRPDTESKDQDAWAQSYYEAAWQAVMDAVLERGGSISHHHGIGINRARFMAPALGRGLGLMAAIKDALDPRGILNPGKLGLPSPFGEIHWP